jgi:hypothetical protein
MAHETDVQSHSCFFRVPTSTSQRALPDHFAKIPSGEDREDDKRHQIEQNYSYLEDAHPGIVKSVELVVGQVKPSAMEALNPIMREHEDQEPHQQYPVVGDRTPQKKAAGDFDRHLPPFGIYRTGRRTG